MSTNPVPATNDAANDALFESWLKPIEPRHPTDELIVAKIAPFRRQFVAAFKRGYAWDQLAKDVASKPEIGVKVTGRVLQRYVAEAYTKAGESLPLPRHRRRHARTAAAKPASG